MFGSKSTSTSTTLDRPIFSRVVSSCEWIAATSSMPWPMAASPASSTGSSSDTSVLRGALALLDTLLLDPALVVLELGLHTAGQVQVLVALGRDLLGDLDHLDELTLEHGVLGDVGISVGAALGDLHHLGVEDLVLDAVRAVSVSVGAPPTGSAPLTCRPR